MSDNNVIDLPVVTRLQLNPDRVLSAALKEGLTKVIVIGYDKEGEEYFASSDPDGGSVLWLIERAKLSLLLVKVE